MTDGGLEAVARAAEVFCNVVKESKETTVDSIQTEHSLEGNATCFDPSTERPNLTDLLKSGPSKDDLVSSAQVEKESKETTITTLDLIQTEHSLEGSATCFAPLSTERPNLTDLLKSETSKDDLVDFRGLARVPRCYASLLERACISHPNLAVCSKKSLRWREFAYRTLGELLFFLMFTKRKEMTHKACEHLRVLWEDTKDLGFDLSWLAPVMESDFTSFSEMENICLLEADKGILRAHRNNLHCQLTTLTMQIAEADKELANLRKVLRHAKKKLEASEEEFLYTDL